MTRWMTTTLAACVVLGSATVLAATVPQYDMNLYHTRDVTVTHADQYYSALPIYVQVPGLTSSQTSLSTPNMIGNTASQYTWDHGTGYLYRVTFPPINATSIANHKAINGQYAVFNTPSSYSVTQIPAGYQTPPSGGTDFAAGQSSMTTGPYVPSGTNGQGTLTAETPLYQAIAVGRYLYTWPQASYPTASPIFGSGNPHVVETKIVGVTGNHDHQVDASPLITPPISYPMTCNGSSTPVPQTTPVAVALSWDGGAVAKPLNIPSGCSASSHHFVVTDGFSSSTHFTTQDVQQAALTSDATWIGSADGLGHSVVAFGVSNPYDPSLSGWVVLWDVAKPTTASTFHLMGVHHTRINGPIWDAAIDDPATQTLTVQSAYGNLYTYSTTNASLIQQYPTTATSSWIDQHPGTLTIAKDMTLDNGTLYAVGKGNTLIGAFSPSTLTPVCQTSVGKDYYQGCSSTTVSTANYSQNGASVASPGTLNSLAGHNTLVISNSNGTLWLESARNLFANSTGTFRQTTTTPQKSTYIGFVPDAGSQHLILSWTNSDPNGVPAFIVLAPQPYTSSTGLDEYSTNTNQTTVNITASVSPTGITSVNNPYSVEGTGSPVAFEIINGITGQPLTNITTGNGTEVPASAQGYYAYNQALNSAGKRMPGEWTINWKPPPNAQSPTPYTIKTMAEDALGQTASSQATFTDNAPVDTGGSGGPITIGGGGGGGTVTSNGYLTFKAYGRANLTYLHPTGTADLGDTVVATLHVPASAITVNGGTYESAYLKQATLTYPHGSIVVTDGNASAVTNVITRTMTTNGLTATHTFLENWAGFPPPTPPQTNDGIFTLTAHYTIAVTYQYTTSTTTCSTVNGKIDTKSCHTTIHYHTATADQTGTSHVSMTITGTDWYIIPVGVKYGIIK